MGFNKLFRNKEFIKEQKEIASILDNLIKNSTKKEPDLVEDIISELNLKNKFISVNSEFIHGSKSQVKFNYNNKKDTQREAGDILFSISLFKNKNLLGHKISFTQVKKKELFKWKPQNGEKEQLYFLSKFPKFKGVSGVFPKEKIILKDYSKTLGTYTFLNKKFGIEFISAYILSNFVLKNQCCFNLLNNNLKCYLRHPSNYNSCLYCPETFNFVENLTEFRIGELIRNNGGIPFNRLTVNKEARDIFVGIFKYLKNKHDDSKLLKKYFSFYRKDILENKSEYKEFNLAVIDIQINLRELENEK